MDVLTLDPSRTETANGAKQVIERANSGDLAYLAMDTGKVPQQFAVILILERPDDFSIHHRPILDVRIPEVP
jgi:hypothetical protein